MGKTIWKFKLDEDMIGVDMPIGAQVLTIRAQGGVPYIWALVDPDNKNENRVFCIHDTGHEISSSHAKEYIGTFEHEKLVFHVFELINT